MDKNIISESKTENFEYFFLRKTTYKIGILIVALMAINLILYHLIPIENYHLLGSDGSTLTVDEMRKINIRNIVLKIPFLGFVLGSILSLIPFKKMPYKRKYLRYSLLVILVLYIIQFVSFLNLL